MLAKAGVNKEIIKTSSGMFGKQRFTLGAEMISKLTWRKISGHFGSIKAVLHLSTLRGGTWETQEVAEHQEQTIGAAWLNVLYINPAVQHIGVSR